MLKDDKTFPWICIKNEILPRVFLQRNIIKDHFLLDARKVRTWFVDLLQLNGFNDVYNQDCYNVLMPGKVLKTTNGKEFRIIPNKVTLLDNGKVRNQSNFFGVCPYTDLKDCLYTDTLNRGQTKIDKFCERDDSQQKMCDFNERKEELIK